MTNDEGVSAVIGVILMVAITVILAAVIAAFVFGMGSGLQKPKDISVQVHRINNTCIYVETFLGDDTRYLIYSPPGASYGGTGQVGSKFYGVFNVTVNGVELPNSVDAGTPNCTAQIGSIQYFSPVPPNSDVNVIANFIDRSQFLVFSGKI